MNPKIFLFIFMLSLTGSFTACKKDIKLRFVVISDVHFDRSPRAYENTPKALKNLLQKKPLPDAIFVVGDFTESGWPEEYDALMAVFTDRTIVPEGVAVYFMAGNHEHREIRYIGDAQDVIDCDHPVAQKNLRFEHMSSIERFMKKTGQPLHQYVDIKGYPFITISLTAGDNLYAGDIIWPNDSVRRLYDKNAIHFLSEKMADAAQNYPGKPIFLFSHIGSTSTCFGTFPQDDGGQNQFPPILEGYPQTVFFNGHSHFPIGDPRTIHQERYTSVNDGSTHGMSGIKYYIPPPYLPHTSQRYSEGLIVNILKDGSVEIERWDAFRNEEILPRWRLEPPFDGSRFVYAKRDGLPAPIFEASATVTGYVVGSDLIVCFPRATDNEVVNHYFLEFLEEDGTVIYSGNKFSEFYLNSQMPEVYAIRFPLLGKDITVNLPPCKTFQVRVTAVDSYGNLSMPIVSDLLAIPSSFLREQPF